MQCPHCGTKFTPDWRWCGIPDECDDDIGWGLRMALCKASSCGKPIVMARTFRRGYDGAGRRNSEPIWNDEQDYLVWPRKVQRIPLGDEVPEHIKDDYREACALLSVSAKASAALSRRVLEAILEQQGYKTGTLGKKIETALTDGRLPDATKDALDTARLFGNFSAHPPANHSPDRIVDVENGEAEWCLDVIERLVDYYYIAPSRSAAIAARDESMQNRATELGKARKPESK